MLGKYFSYLRQYGPAVCFRYFCWLVLSQKWLGFTSSNRSRMLNLFAKIFSFFGIKSLRIKSNLVYITIDPRDAWALRAFVFEPLYDYKIINSIKKNIPSDFEFLDIGANYGIWSLSLSDHFKKIVAFEPSENCLRCFRKSTELNQYKAITVSEKAVSDIDGEGLFFESTSSSADGRIYNPGDLDHESGNPIQTISMPRLKKEFNLTFKKVFIKLDVQGAEPRVIKSLAKLLGDIDELYLFTEIQPSMLVAAGNSLDSVISQLQDLGLRPVDILNDFKNSSWDNVIRSRPSQRDFCFKLTQ